MTPRLARWTLGIVGGLLLLAATSAIVVETAWFKERLRRIVVDRAAETLNGQLAIGRLTGSLLTGVELYHVVLTQPSGPVLAVERLALRYDPRLLLRGHLVFQELSLTRPVVHLTQQPDGWNITTLVKPTSGGRKTEVHFRKLSIVDGDLSVRPAAASARHFSDLNASLGLSYTAGHLEVNLDGLQARDVDTGWTLRRVEARVETDRDRLTATLNLDSSAGAIFGTLAGRPQQNGRVVDGHFSVTRLNLALVMGRLDAVTDITGNLQVQSTLPATPGDPSRARAASGRPAPAIVSFQVESPTLSAVGYSARDVKATGSYSRGVLRFDGSGSAYNAYATARGEWRTASAPSSANVLRLAGRFRELDVRRVPASFQAPKLASRMAGRYAFTYHPARWDVVVRFDRSELEGGEIGEGTIARASLRGGVPTYGARGRVARFDLRRIGRALGIATLTRPRFRGSITGDVHVEGRGRSLNDTVLEADALLQDSKIGATRLDAASVRASLTGRRLVVDFSGPFEHLDSELIGAGKPPFDVSGVSDGVRVVLRDLRAPLNLDTLEAEGRVTLTPSMLAGYDVDKAVVDASLAGGAATIRALHVEGIELQATAEGTVALDAESESNLTFVVDAQNVETAGTRFGWPVAGAVHLEGTVTGPSDRITAAGTIAAREFKYGSAFDALTLNGTFGVDVVNQQWRDAAVRADTTATFARLGGMDVDRLTTSATYSATRLDLDTRIEQRSRTIELGGAVLLHPEHREVHLRQLAVTTANQTWALPAGQEAVVQYGEHQLTVRGLTLANGSERLAVDGVLGAGGTGPAAAQGLAFTAENVQLADVTQLVSRNWDVTGVLNGSAHVSGTTTAPVLSSDFTVSNGTVAKTAFQGLTAKVGYRARQMTLDATLDQQPGAQLRATGTVPLALGEAAAPTGDIPLDVRVTSTAIDLGVFQAFATHFSDVTGTGRFNVHITGTPKAPRVDGAVDIADAAFTVPALGVSYAGGNASLRFDGGRVAIDRFVIQDDDRHTLTAEGGAEVADGRTIRSVDLHIVADDLHLLRNQFGDVGVDVDLKATGALQRLDVTGTARVERTRLEVDKLFERFNKTAYATEAGSPVTRAAEQTALPEAGEPAKDATPAARIERAARDTLFDNMKIDVRVAIPDDLILRARNLRLSEGTAALGSTNLTLGGTLAARKDPGANVIVLGAVEVVRGYYEFQGRRFDIVRGSEVRFRGTQPIDPALSVSAEREISGIETHVRVGGTARQPSVQLSSYPPLDESDILSLIVFGQPVNALGQAQRVNLAERAGNLALGAAASPIAESVGRALNLDLFEVRAQGQGGGAELALGSQLGSRIFIGLRQEFGKEDVSTVSFEYRLSRLLRLVTSVAQGVQQTHATRRTDPTGADLIFVIRY